MPLFFKIGGSELSSLKNGWKCVAFVKNGWEWVVFVEKCVAVGRFCHKMCKSMLFLLKNGWEWVRVAGSG